MTTTATRLLIGIALVAGATGARAQMSNSGPSAPAPGTGDASHITQGNQQNNAEYNRLIGATDPKPNKGETRPVHSSPVAAVVADIKPGSGLRDLKGVPIGTIVSVDASQAVVDTGKTKIGVPLMAFGKDDNGLLLGMTADKFNQLVAEAHAH